MPMEKEQEFLRQLSAALPEMYSVQFTDDARGRRESQLLLFRNLLSKHTGHIFIIKLMSDVHRNAVYDKIHDEPRGSEERKGVKQYI